MGHAVYSISDPRAVAFKQFVEMLANEKHQKKEFELYSMIVILFKICIIFKIRTFYCK